MPDQQQAPPEHILQYFEYEHLPNYLQIISAPFCMLARNTIMQLPRNPERTVALRKLLESKDAAVRAALDKKPEAGIDARALADTRQHRPATASAGEVTASPAPGEFSYGGRDFRGVTVDGVVIGSEQHLAMIPAHRAQLVLTGEARRRQKALDDAFDAWWEQHEDGYYETYLAEQATSDLPVKPKAEWAWDVISEHKSAYIRRFGWPEGDPNDPALTDARNFDIPDPETA